MKIVSQSNLNSIANSFESLLHIFVQLSLKQQPNLTAEDFLDDPVVQQYKKDFAVLKKWTKRK